MGRWKAILVHPKPKKKRSQSEKPPSKDSDVAVHWGKQQRWPCEQLEKFSYEDLKLLTDNFSEANFVCYAHFGKVYRGKIPEGYKTRYPLFLPPLEFSIKISGKEVIVKTWEDQLPSRGPSLYNLIRFGQEMSFLTSPSIREHPNIAKLMGYCSDDERLGFVYDLKVSGVLHNFVPKGTLKWIDRMKIAFDLARTLEYLHELEPQYLVRDLSAFRILLDQELKPILFDFATITGGVVGQTPTALTKHYVGPHAYTDSHVIETGSWTERTDVFAFGIILLELMCKVTVDGIRDGNQFLDYYARERYTLPVMGCARVKYSLAKKKLGSRSCKEERVKFANPCFHKERGYAASDDVTLSMMARLCFDLDINLRPYMREVVKELLDLARSHYKELGA